MRLEATSTSYLNLTEPGKTLIDAITYRVVKGRCFLLTPSHPAEGWRLASLQVNGRSDGFRRDERADGTVEIRLDGGVPAGGRVAVIARWEQTGLDWVPEQGGVNVRFLVPRAGADHEEGYVGVGADASFQVLDTAVADLAPLGAAELTLRGVSPVGLLFGYRLDGPRPEVTLAVTRRAPRIEAEVVAVARPRPRRLEVEAAVLHTIERAGVRRLLVDVPLWAGDDVRIEAPDVLDAHRLAGASSVPAGFVRWEVSLARRTMGRHALAVRYHEEETSDDWSVPAGRPLAPRLPLDRVDRSVVVERAPGLEVNVLGDAPSRDLAELPPEAAVDPLGVREVVRLPGEMDGPGIQVTKHAGAPVLDAIATAVTIRTAVASEGILRSRASVRLVNVGRQVLEVVLPPRSTLIGAVVDRDPVKPLAGADGRLLIPIPPTRQRGRTTEAHLTWETRLGGPIGGHVTIPSPTFPGLEVLQTHHEVSFDPALRVERVAGDYGALGGARARFAPWVATLLGGLGPRTVTGARSAPARSRGPVGRDVAEPRRAAEEVSLLPSNFTPPEPSDPASVGPDAVVFRDHAEDDDGDGTWQGRGEQRYDAGPPAVTTPPTPTAPGSTPSPTGPPPPAALPPPVAAQPAGGAPAAGRGAPAPGGEGPGAPPSPPRPTAGAPSKKGLLSLDVPVLLSPNRLEAERLGTGGTIEVYVARETTLASRRWIFLLAFVAAGLFFARRSRARRVGTPLVLAGLAFAVYAAFGSEGALEASALLDAATVLVVVLVASWLARATVLRAPRATAASLVLLLLVLAPRTARADGKSAAKPAAKPAAPPTVYVPFDPNDPSVPRADDRVFLPLEAWQRLVRLARPNEDPEVALQGRTGAATAVAHALVVKDGAAEGVTTIDLEKRGPGALWLALPLTGVAVTASSLDGEPVELALEGGMPNVAIEAQGAHHLEIRYRVPLVPTRDGVTLAWRVPPFARAVLDVEAPGFDGVARVEKAARVQASGAGRWHVDLGPIGEVRLALVHPEASEPVVQQRTRAESRVVHLLADGGTESRASVRLHVLQGEARSVTFAVPSDVSILDATGPAVSRWDEVDGGVRLTFSEPVTGSTDVALATFRAAPAPGRQETLPELSVQGTTGESGVVVVLSSVALRVDVDEGGTTGFFRTQVPAKDTWYRIDPSARVVGAWRFAARPTRFVARAEPVEASLATVARASVLFGEGRVRSRFDVEVEIDPRRPLGELVLDAPGTDEVRTLVAPGLDTWWAEGEGEGRTLHLRFGDLVSGRVLVRVAFEKRLAADADTAFAPRLALEGVNRDVGTLVLYALPDVEIAPGALPGLRTIPVASAAGPVPDEDAEARQAFAWDAPLGASLPVALGTPALEVEAVVVSAARPGEEATSVDHLVVFDVRRGLQDRFSLFVPDGGFADADVVRTRDLREIRQEPARRRGADGVEVEGTLYTLRLQTARGGPVEVTVSQALRPDHPLRVVRPEDVKSVHWFTLLGGYADGEVDSKVLGGAPDPAAWDELPFLPTALTAADVVRAWTAREPFVLDVAVRPHTVQLDADAVVRSARAIVVVGRDGEARIELTYRLFNRRRLFLRVRMPGRSLLYGVTAGGVPVKPLDGGDGDLLVPIPKVPLGGGGYPVTLLYRAPVGDALPSGSLELVLPEVVGIALDRTVVALYAPEGFRYDFDTDMTPSEAKDLKADLAEAAVKEAKDLLEVVKNGTLAQRSLAAQSCEVVVKQAESWNDGAGRSRSGLNFELDQVRRELEARVATVNKDVEREQAVRSQTRASDLYASNAAPILQTEDGALEAGQNVGWRLNRRDAEKGGAKNEEAEALKERYGKAFERRKQKEAQEAPADDLGQTEAGPTSGGEATGNDLHAQNLEGLNAALAEDQSKNDQLGTAELEVEITQAANRVSRPRGRQSAFFLFGGDADLGRHANPQMGFPTSVAGAGAGPGGGAGWAASTSFDSGLVPSEDGYAGFGMRSYGLGGGGGGAVQAPRGRGGLMGVDVALPAKGRVFYFRSLKAGSPIRIDASREGPAPALRWVLFLAIVGLGVVLTLLVGRAAAGRAAGRVPAAR